MQKSYLLTAILAMTLGACSQTTAPHHHTSTHSPKHSAHAAPYVHNIASKYTFAETVSRLQTAMKNKGMNVFATIDHRAAAKQSGLTMQPATVLVFGTPKAGTPLMVKDPEFALQLPLRVLVTEINGEVRVVFMDTHHLIHGSKIEYADVENTLANAEKLIRATVSQ